MSVYFLFYFRVFGFSSFSSSSVFISPAIFIRDHSGIIGNMSALGQLVTRAYDLVVIGAGSGGLEVCHHSHINRLSF
jgi:hypothetical protein